jgi:actin-related protein
MNNIVLSGGNTMIGERSNNNNTNINNNNPTTSTTTTTIRNGNGIVTRLSNEIKLLLPSLSLSLSATSSSPSPSLSSSSSSTSGSSSPLSPSLLSSKSQCNVIAPNDRKHSVWIGGSILSSLSTFKHLVMTKDVSIHTHYNYSIAMPCSTARSTSIQTTRSCSISTIDLLWCPPIGV